MIMKIQKSKTAVKASNAAVGVANTACPECDIRTEAINYIQSAISALSACALETPDDVVVTDSIANLGVVLLDLQGAK